MHSREEPVQLREEIVVNIHVAAVTPYGQISKAHTHTVSDFRVVEQHMTVSISPAEDLMAHQA